MWIATDCDGAVWLYSEEPRYDEQRKTFDTSPGARWQLCNWIGLKPKPCECKKLVFDEDTVVEAFLGLCSKHWDNLPSVVQRSLEVVQENRYPVTTTIGKWEVSDGTTCYVFTDGKRFITPNGTVWYNVTPKGRIESTGRYLVRKLDES